MADKSFSTNEQVMEKVRTLAGLFSLEEICDFIGVNYKEVHTYPEIVLAFKSGRVLAIGKIAKKVFQMALNGDIRAAELYLKAKAGWKDSVEIKLPDVEDKFDWSVLNENDLRELIRIAEEGKGSN